MKQYKVTLYIGSPNDTRQIDSDYLSKIRTWADAHLEATTMLRGTGTWHGTSEDTILLVHIADSPIEDKHIGELKRILNQECIMVECQEVDIQFI
uniref:Uncharacterized protein n=1 Tax=viral metagenome TaxID=1070528 RepID=A0A6M3JE92_9ZZZZ